MSGSRALKEETYYVVAVENNEAKSFVDNAKESYENVEENQTTGFVGYVLKILKQKGYIKITAEKPKKNQYWGDSEIVAVTNFIKDSGSGAFQSSFIRNRCLRRTQHCNPFFDYSTGQPRGAEDRFPADREEIIGIQ